MCGGCAVEEGGNFSVGVRLRLGHREIAAMSRTPEKLGEAWMAARQWGATGVTDALLLGCGGCIRDLHWLLAWIRDGRRSSNALTGRPSGVGNNMDGSDAQQGGRSFGREGSMEDDSSFLLAGPECPWGKVGWMEGAMGAVGLVNSEQEGSILAGFLLLGVLTSSIPEPPTAKPPPSLLVTAPSFFRD